VVKKVLQGEEAKISFGIAEKIRKLALAIPIGTLYSSRGRRPSVSA
jgi:hypothetical protein